MIACMMLLWLGWFGSVWSVCIVFFQAALLPAAFSRLRRALPHGETRRWILGAVRGCDNRAAVRPGPGDPYFL